MRCSRERCRRRAVRSGSGRRSGGTRMERVQWKGFNLDTMVQLDNFDEEDSDDDNSDGASDVETADG